MRIILTVFICAFLALPAFASDKLGPTATHAAVKAGTLLLIDIRRPDEWRETGSAQGALRIDMLSENFTTRIKALQAANPNKKIALICQTGVRTSRLSKRLEASGLTGIVDVVGGTSLWIEKGLPINR
jgi:rhodanese-related sulfurtransferase